MSELQDLKVEFEANSKHSVVQEQLLNSKNNKMANSTTNHSSSLSSSSRKSSFSKSGCVHELRTLEDQLEAALASLSLTINDCITTNIDTQLHPSSDSSACSSGVGDEIGSEPFHSHHMPSTNHHNVPLKSKMNPMTDDCDSAYSDSGSTDKVTVPNHNESVRIYKY